MTATRKYFGMLFLLATCATFVSAQIKVKTDYDHKAKFTEYRTFMWLREPQTLTPEMKRPLMTAVNVQLRARGWRLVKANPDVVVAAHTATKEQKSLQTFYAGDGGWRFRLNTDTEPDPNAETFTIGTLVVDLFDYHGEHAIFRGTATGKVLSDTVAVKTVRMNKIITEMFKDFPPQKKNEVAASQR